MKKIFIFLFFPSLLISQISLSSDEFFEIAITKDASKLPKGKNLKAPWIEEYELRTETRDLELQQQEYTFRVSPSTVRKRKAQNDLYQHFKNTPDFEAEEDYCDALYSLYFDWINLFIIQKNVALISSLQTVFNDKQKIYARLASNLDFDPSKLIKLHTDKSDLDIASQELGQRTDYILAKHNLSERRPQFEDFISLGFINNQVLKFSVTQALLTDPEFRYDKESISKELSLELAERNQFFDFAQIRYRGPHDNEINERISFGLGIRLPKSGNRKLKIKELQIEQEILEKEEERRIDRQKKLIHELQSKLSISIKVYEDFVSTIEKEREELLKIGEGVTKREGYSPLILLEIEERHYKNQITQIKKEEKILADYITLLELSGDLCARPFVNYLKE